MSCIDYSDGSDDVILLENGETNGGMPEKLSSAVASLVLNESRTCPGSDKINLNDVNGIERKGNTTEAILPGVNVVPKHISGSRGKPTTNLTINERKYEGDSGKWKSAARPTRHGLTGYRKQNSVTVRRQNDRMAQQFPGEWIMVDDRLRYVVWSKDLEMARRSISQKRFAVIIIRGVPGSGKSRLAESLQANGILCSADEYFTDGRNGYNFDPSRLADAHNWCFQRAMQAVTNCVTPIIIDNTSVHLWEMEKYVKLAIRNFYDIYFLEPDTSWNRDARECQRRNTHRVPIEAIERMIQEFEPVVTVRPFFEGGRIRIQNKITRNEPTRDENATIPLAAVPVARTLEENMKREPVDARSNDEIWVSDADASWTDEDKPKASSLPPRSPGQESSMAPKEQRPTPQPSEANAPDSKQPNGSGRRRRQEGFGILSAFTQGTWNLPEDLVGGLSSAPSADLLSSGITSNEVSVSKSVVNVCDASVQVTDKHLALASVSHRRLDRRSLDDCEGQLDQRPYVKTADGDRPVFKCDASVQCGYDSSVLTAGDDEGYKKAMATLRSCFPQVDQEDIQEFFGNCDHHLEWTINLLLDSGYDVDWTTNAGHNASESDTPAVAGQQSENGSSQVELNKSFAAGGENMKIAERWKPYATESNQHARVDSSPLPDSLSMGTDQDAHDSECPLYSMELSVDMATQLQRIFSPIFPDIPSDILSPMQLKVRLPDHLAAELYRYWLETQTNGMKDGESEFFEGMSEEAALQDSPGGSGLTKQQIADAGTDEDTLTTEKQIWTDELLARQLAFEEEETERDSSINAAPLKNPLDSMASKIKLNRLHELFPSVERAFLKEVFNSTNCHLDKTIGTLCNTYNIPKASSTGASARTAEATGQDKDPPDEEDWEDPSETLTYDDLRKEALLHYSQRQSNYQKAQEYFRKGMAPVAAYYAQRGRLHNNKFKEANELAAKRILQQRRAENADNVLDLHGLHVPEAVHALVDKLREYENRNNESSIVFRLNTFWLRLGPGKEVKIITGRGIHSTNGPKIKPAVLNYLRQRGYSFMELSPGVLLVTMK